MNNLGGTSGRSASQISIYDYPEHLNPFYEDENHKRLRFWNLNTLNKNKNKTVRRNSFSLDGIKDIWAFKSFRLNKKKSSTLGINKTSESPPPLRRHLEPSNTNYSTIDSRQRHTVGIGTNNNFLRNSGYRSSLQDVTTVREDNNGFIRNNRYRGTLQNTDRYGDQNHYLSSASVTPLTHQRNTIGMTPGSSQSSLYSTNPFDDDEDDVNVTINKIKKPARKKRRAPQPPVMVSKIINNEDTYNNNINKNLNGEDKSNELSNLTAEIESFVQNTKNDDNLEKKSEKIIIVEKIQNITNDVSPIIIEEKIINSEIDEPTLPSEIKIITETTTTASNNLPTITEHQAVTTVTVTENPKVTTSIAKEEPKTSTSTVIETPKVTWSTVKEQSRVTTLVVKEEPKVTTSTVIEQPKVTWSTVKEKPKVVNSTIKETTVNSTVEKTTPYKESYVVTTLPFKSSVSNERNEEITIKPQLIIKTDTEEIKPQLEQQNVKEVIYIVDVCNNNNQKQTESIINNSKSGNGTPEPRSPISHEVETILEAATPGYQSKNTSTTNFPKFNDLTITESLDNLNKSNQSLNHIPTTPTDTSKTIKTENYEFRVRYVPLRDDSTIVAQIIDEQKDEKKEPIPIKRKSVKEIIESINRSQRLLKVNQELLELQDNQITEITKSSDDLTKNLKQLEADEIKIDTFLNDINNEKKMGINDSIDSNRVSHYDNIPVMVEEFEELNNNNIENTFEKCTIRKNSNNNNNNTNNGNTNNKINNSPEIEWNPIPKPRRSRHYSEDI